MHDVGQILFDNIYEEGTMNLWRAPAPFAFRLLISVLRDLLRLS